MLCFTELPGTLLGDTMYSANKACSLKSARWEQNLVGLTTREEQVSQPAPPLLSPCTCDHLAPLTSSDLHIPLSATHCVWVWEHPHTHTQTHGYVTCTESRGRELTFHLTTCFTDFSPTCKAVCLAFMLSITLSTPLPLYPSLSLWLLILLATSLFWIVLLCLHQLLLELVKTHAIANKSASTVFVYAFKYFFQVS